MSEILPPPTKKQKFASPVAQPEVPPSDLMQELLAEEAHEKNQIQPVVDILEFLKTGVSRLEPVKFDEDYAPEYSHLNGKLELDAEGKVVGGCGLFIRQMNLPDRTHHHKLCYPKGTKKPIYNDPTAMMWLVCKSACDWQGDLIFDYDDEEVVTLLTDQAVFTEQIYFDAMTKNGYMAGTLRKLVKNSDTTGNSSSESN